MATDFFITAREYQPDPIRTTRFRLILPNKILKRGMVGVDSTELSLNVKSLSALPSYTLNLGQIPYMTFEESFVTGGKQSGDLTANIYIPQTGTILNQLTEWVEIALNGGILVTNGTEKPTLGPINRRTMAGLTNDTTSSVQKADQISLGLGTLKDGTSAGAGVLTDVYGVKRSFGTPGQYTVTAIRNENACIEMYNWQTGNVVFRINLRNLMPTGFSFTGNLAYGNQAQFLEYALKMHYDGFNIYIPHDSGYKFGEYGNDGLFDENNTSDIFRSEYETALELSKNDEAT
jgi:hypothetical protein